MKSAAADWTVGDGEPGPVTMRLREALLDIQTGRALTLPAYIPVDTFRVRVREDGMVVVDA